MPLLEQLGEGSVTSCGLVRAITGLEAGAVAVGRDACAACCALDEPTVERLNPVVASLLSRATGAVLGNDDLPEAVRVRASALRDWARQNLDVGYLGGIQGLPERAGRSCADLGDPVPDRVPEFFCRHPDHATTTLDGCHRCRDWSGRTGPRPLPVPLASSLPAPGPRLGPPVRRWGVGVTTAPRRHPTVDWSIDSLIRAGWEAPRLFLDSAVALAARTARLPATIRATRLGAWPNYYLALLELVMAEPEADAYLMAQDDALFYDRQDVRAYLETILWPTDPPGLVSLYCPSAYTRPEPGWHAIAEPWLWGAVAFLFPRGLARRFLADPDIARHRWEGPNQGLAQIDALIGVWAEARGIPIHFPCPSLVQHIGDASTIWRADRALGRRKADRFLGESDP